MPRVDHYDTGVPCWVDLSTTEPDGAVAFYTEVFGWQHQPVPTDTDRTYHMFTQDGAVVAACMAQPPEQAEAGVPAAWTTYIAGNPDEVAKRTPDAGGQVLAAPFDVMDSGRMTVITDPSGAVLGVWQAGRHLGAELVNEPVSVTWNELNTTDLDASAQFLEQVFDVTTQDLPEVETGYRTFHAGGDPVGGILQMTEDWEGIPPHWMCYFAVADTDATAGAVTDAGGTVSVEPFDSPFGRMAVLTDPQGAVFMISSRPATA